MKSEELDLIKKNIKEVLDWLDNANEDLGFMAKNVNSAYPMVHWNEGLIDDLRKHFSEIISNIENE